MFVHRTIDSAVRARYRLATAARPRRLANAGPLVAAAFAIIGLLGSGCEGDRGNSGPAGPPGPGAAGPQQSGDGFIIEITSVRLSASRRPIVEFTITDEDGVPLEVADLDGNPTFVLGHIEVDAISGLTRFQSDLLRVVTGASFQYDGQTVEPALAQATQATSDSGGSFESLGDGGHRYTFGNALPVDYDRNALHRIAVYASRVGRLYVDNDEFDLTWSGAPPPAEREVVVDADCRRCHAQLAIHGGLRRDVGLCVVCHTDQTVDPETGENLDFDVMIHRIHNARGLAAQPYLVVGFRQSVLDFTEEVGFPRDVRDCATCHQNGAHAEHWRTMPSRQACGSCHDDVDFETGSNHQGVQQFDDFFCNRCHRPDAIVEFDRTVPGAHVIPYQSSVNPALRLAITGVTNLTAGAQPTVDFTLSDRSGPVDITTLDRVAIVFAGPTSDYSQLLAAGNNLTIRGGGATAGLVANAVGDYSYTPAGYALSVDASGTWSVGMEARTAATAAGDESIRFGANNPVVHVDTSDGTLGGGTPLPRREVADSAKCDTCHGDLILHGNLRTDLEYCVLCHNTWATDEARRPGLDAVANPPASIDFKWLVHKIHRGSDLEVPYTVYGFGSTPHDYTEIRFPGDVRDCESCHLAGTHLLPLAETNSPTVVNIAGVPAPQATAIRTPAAAACTSCHDSLDAVTHARLASIVESPTDWGESCSVCHGEGSTVAVSQAHAGD